MEVADQIDVEERQMLMALSQTYLEWEKQTKREGLKLGSELATRSAIGSLLRFKFREVDGDLEGLMPQLMALNSDDYTRLILESSKEELIRELSNLDRE